jgi:uncharacterized LabA/DUF88 family protein
LIAAVPIVTVAFSEANSRLLLGQAMADCLILVDNSNIFIEGRKYAAQRKGVVATSPDERQPQDPSWRLDFTGLLGALADGRHIAGAILVGSRPPRNDQVWTMARQQGFDVFVHDRDAQNREKAVDTDLVARGTEFIVSRPETGTLVIASGDRDFIPLVGVAQRRGWGVEMCAFTSAFSPYGEMATAVDRVRPLDAVFEQIGRYEFDWP